MGDSVSVGVAQRVTQFPWVGLLKTGGTVKEYLEYSALENWVVAFVKLHRRDSKATSLICARVGDDVLSIVMGGNIYDNEYLKRRSREKYE